MTLQNSLHISLLQPTNGRQAKPRPRFFRVGVMWAIGGNKGRALAARLMSLFRGGFGRGVPSQRISRKRRRRTDEKGGAGDFPRVDQKKRPWPHRCTLCGGFSTFSRNSQRLLDTYITCLNPLLFVMCGQKYMAKRREVRTEIHGECGQKYIVPCWLKQEMRMRTEIHGGNH